MYSIAVFNDQQHAGKTAITLNLGHALALAGHPVTLVDLDPVGELSTGLGLFRQPTLGIDQVFLGAATLNSVAISTRNALHLIPAGGRLGKLVRDPQPEGHDRMLRQALASGVADQAFILFDCSSRSGVLAVNLLPQVDRVLLPVTGDDSGAAGLPRLLERVQRLGAVRGRAQEFDVLVNRVPVRRRLTGVSASRFTSLAPDHFFKSVICQADPINESRAAGRTVFEFRPNSRSVTEFRQLAAELLRRVERGG